MSDSRAEFESWATSEDGPYVTDDMERFADGCYVSIEVRAAWQAWKASRAQPERKLTDAELPKPDVHLAWSDDGENIRFWTRNAGHAREWENENWPTESYFSAEQMRALLASQPASDVPETNCGNMAAQPAASHSVCHDCRVSPDGAHQDHCPEAAAQPAADPIAEFAAKLAAKQQPLPAEFAKVLHDNLWELYARDENAAQPAAATVPNAALMQKVTSLLNEIASFNELNEFNYTNEDVAEINNWGVMVWDAAEEVRKALPAAQAQDDGEKR